MTFTIPAIWVPFILTLACLAMMFRPYRSSSDYDLGEIFRLFWLLPIGFIWAAYFAIGWWFSTKI